MKKISSLKGNNHKFRSTDRKYYNSILKVRNQNLFKLKISQKILNKSKGATLKT